MSIIAGTAIESALGGYQIQRSLRFNSADSAYLSRAVTTTGNRQKWTYSGWVKKSTSTETNIDVMLFGSGPGNSTTMTQIRLNDGNGGWTLWMGSFNGSSYDFQTQTTALFRDPSAWYHIVVAVDTTQATAADRVKFYSNGVLQARDSSNPSLNYNTYVNLSSYNNYIGAYAYNVATTTNGYMTEIHFIDGSALDPTSFGEYNSNTGVWQPIAYTGSYGTNGFYLNFSDNSNTTSTTLGKDYSGNSNNWTPNNFSVTAGAGNDSLIDTPTPYGTDTGVGGEVRGNYCTLNPLDEPSTYASFGSSANGNLDFSVSNDAAMGSTISVSSGKWYWEMTVVSGHSSGANTVWTAITSITPSSSNKLAWQAGSGSRSYATTGLKYSENTSASYGNTYTNGDVIGCALDLDNGKVYWSKNGTFQASGDPVAGTNAAYTGLTGSWMPEATQNGAVTAWNFGQRPFAYTAPSGFKALCTQNLPDPTIADGGDYFNPVLYTGNAATNTITTGFAPDLVWIKDRSFSSGSDHFLFDKLRTTYSLSSNTTGAETQKDIDGFTSLNSTGFTLNGNGGGDNINRNASSFVAWNWKAGGTGVTNTAGTITSTVSANTTAGFSIVTYTGNGSSSATFGHNLGSIPKFVIIKARSRIEKWCVSHTSLATNGFLYLNLTDAANTASTIFQTASFTSSVVGIGDNAGVNNNTDTYVAYCFAPVAGYSAFGSYTGNGSTDGPFVYTGFRPAFILTKRTDSTSDWWLMDDDRLGYNGTGAVLKANANYAEASNTTWTVVDQLSNGFKIRYNDSDNNASGGTYIYAAFAENPFKYALAR